MSICKNSKSSNSSSCHFVLTSHAYEMLNNILEDTDSYQALLDHLATEGTKHNSDLHKCVSEHFGGDTSYFLDFLKLYSHRVANITVYFEIGENTGDVSRTSQDVVVMNDLDFRRDDGKYLTTDTLGPCGYESRQWIHHIGPEILADTGIDKEVDISRHTTQINDMSLTLASPLSRSEDENCHYLMNRHIGMFNYEEYDSSQLVGES